MNIIWLTHQLEELTLMASLVLEAYPLLIIPAVLLAAAGLYYIIDGPDPHQRKY